MPPEEEEKDTKEWGQRVSQMLGDWLKPETPVKEVCAFSDQIFVRRDLSGFKGKRMIQAADFGFRLAFALCPYSPEAVFRYVNLLTGRSSI